MAPLSHANLIALYYNANPWAGCHSSQRRSMPRVKGEGARATRACVLSSGIEKVLVREKER